MYILRIVKLRRVLPWPIINKGATRQLRRDSLRWSNVAAGPRIIFLRRGQSSTTILFEDFKYRQRLQRGG